MENKVAIITGGSRGIGAETSRLLVQHGYSICINYVNDDASALKLQEELRSVGGECLIVKADVSDALEVSRLFEVVDSKLGKLSLLVNNAGILMKQCRLDEISNDRFAKVIQTNLMSCFYCCKEAVKRMSTYHGGSGGVIINVSSGASKTGSPNEYVDYAASKGAIDTLTRGLALEVANEGIRVNAVRPGFIYTDMHASGGEPERVDRLKNKIPMRRGGSAKEIADTVIWLATDKSSFVTGSFIDVSGGM